MNYINLHLFLERLSVHQIFLPIRVLLMGLTVICELIVGSCPQQMLSVFKLRDSQMSSPPLSWWDGFLYIRNIYLTSIKTIECPPRPLSIPPLLLSGIMQLCRVLRSHSGNRSHTGLLGWVASLKVSGPHPLGGKSTFLLSFLSSSLPPSLLPPFLPSFLSAMDSHGGLWMNTDAHVLTVFYMCLEK